MQATALWQRYAQQLYFHEGLGLYLDCSRSALSDAYRERLRAPLQRAFAAMDGAGGRRHRQSRREPHGRSLLAARAGAGAARRPAAGDHRNAGARRGLRARRARRARSAAPGGEAFTDVLFIGIGGSALGPQLAGRCAGRAGAADARALHRQHRPGRHRPYARRISARGWRDTLVVVISKSGGTPETRNGMLEVRDACRQAGSRSARTTRSRSPAPAASWTARRREGWLARFPMWDWVGGRTSDDVGGGSAAGRAAGARHRRSAGRRGRDGRGDARAATRAHEPGRAAGAGLVHAAGDGRGAKDMVVLPVQGLAAAVLPLSAAARDGIARQGARPGRQRGAPGHRRVRQQGLDRPARLRAAASRRRGQLLRHVHRSAARIAPARRWKSKPASPAATT